MDVDNCKCSTQQTSTCPSQFTAVTLPGGICACRKENNPICPSGWILDIDSCQCEVDLQPSCPDGSTVIPSTAQCTGTTEPTRPGGEPPSECTCVENILRQCSSGELSLDGCFCSVTSTPQHPLGCELNEHFCTCNQCMVFSLEKQYIEQF